MTRVLLILFAIATAIGVGLMARGYLAATERRLAEDAAQATVEVLVVTADLEIGQTVSARTLAWQPWPRRNLNAQYLTRDRHGDAVQRLSGAAARQPLFAGEPVTEAKVVRREAGGLLAIVLREGHRAVTIKVDEAQGLAGLVTPGDHVDVLLTQEVRSGGPGGQEVRRFAETIVRGVRVLGVGQEIKGDDDAKKPAKSVTVEVTPGDAEAIALGRAMGTLSLALRSSFGPAADPGPGRRVTREQDVSGAAGAAEPGAGAALYRGTRRVGGGT